MGENDRADSLWDFMIQTNTLVMANQPVIVVVYKLQKKAVVVDVAIPSDSNTKKKQWKNVEKNKGLKEEAEKMWEVKVTTGV